jgi:hypothetical protein
MILVLTQSSRPDRLEQFYKDNPFLSSAMPFYSIPHPEGFKSFCLSQKAMIERAAQSEDTYSFLLEDDCQIKGNWRETIDYIPAVGKIDILYFGCNLKGIKPEPAGLGINRIKSAWMTHGILYSKEALQFIAKNYQPEKEWQMYDDWLDKQLPEMNAYVLNPMIAYQRPGNSDLWGTFTDYTSTIDEGNKLMAQ